MNVTCATCTVVFDDAERLTYCPHDRFMSEADLKQKIDGIELLGKYVRFVHRQFDGPRRVIGCGPTGMVEIEGMSGEFAPHLFTVAEVSE